jgi:hypothetical protein
MDCTRSENRAATNLYIYFAVKLTSFACLRLLYQFDASDVICFCVHTGPTSQKYQEVFLSRLLSCVTSSQPEVRQAAAYGCGVLGQFGGPGYAQGSKAPPLLTARVSDPDPYGIRIR